MSASFDLDAPGLVVVAARADGCVLARPGAVVVIRRAPVDARHVADVQRALGAASASGKAAMLAAYRLSPHFPVLVEDTSRAEEHVPAVREMDRVLAAFAMVIEFGGIRAAGLRGITRVVWSLARPRAALGIFERLTDASAWLAPRAETVGAPGDPGEYVRLYRIADQLLETIDAQREPRRRGRATS